MLHVKRTKGVYFNSDCSVPITILGESSLWFLVDIEEGRYMGVAHWSVTGERINTE